MSRLQQCWSFFAAYRIPPCCNMPMEKPGDTHNITLWLLPFPGSTARSHPFQGFGIIWCAKTTQCLLIRRGESEACRAPPWASTTIVPDLSLSIVVISNAYPQLRGLTQKYKKICIDCPKKCVIQWQKTEWALWNVWIWGGYDQSPTRWWSLMY